MTNRCNKCQGETRVIVPDDDGYWHWEPCPVCEDLTLATEAFYDGWGDSPPFGVDADLNDDLPY
jgi:hypothetical protein